MFVEKVFISCSSPSVLVSNSWLLHSLKELLELLSFSLGSRQQKRGCERRACPFPSKTTHESHIQCFHLHIIGLDLVICHIQPQGRLVKVVFYLLARDPPETQSSKKKRMDILRQQDFANRGRSNIIFVRNFAIRIMSPSRQMTNA